MAKFCIASTANPVAKNQILHLQPVCQFGGKILIRNQRKLWSKIVNKETQNTNVILERKAPSGSPLNSWWSLQKTILNQQHPPANDLVLVSWAVFYNRGKIIKLYRQCHLTQIWDTILKNLHFLWNISSELINGTSKCCEDISTRIPELINQSKIGNLPKPQKEDLSDRILHT